MAASLISASEVFNDSVRFGRGVNYSGISVENEYIEAW